MAFNFPLQELPQPLLVTLSTDSGAGEINTERMVLLLQPPGAPIPVTVYVELDEGVTTTLLPLLAFDQVYKEYAPLAVRVAELPKQTLLEGETLSEIGGALTT